MTGIDSIQLARGGMRTALLISVMMHLVVGFVSMQIVKFRKVQFIPRQMYTVQIVPVEIQAPPAEQVPPPLPAQQDVVPPPPDEPEEMEPPPEKPKLKKKKKPKPKPKKVIPTTELNKIEDTEPPPEPVPQPATGDMALDVEDFPFAYYIATMKRKIAAYWSVPGAASRTSLLCRVYFRVGRNGSIDSPSVEESSGSFLFDQAAKRAVIQASPLPPLPREFKDDYLGVHFSFAYEKR